MSTRRTSIVLIGMPAAGKSTLGVLLAKRLGKGFLDTDIAIQQADGRTLQAIVDADGHDALRRIEDRVIRGLEPDRQVVATGGSVVYSGPAMAHLRRYGVIVHLRASLETIAARIGDLGDRGLAKRHDQTLADLYRERLPLYAGHAEIDLDVDHGDQDSLVEALAERLDTDRPG